jgi:chemotaxis protein MotB
MIDAGQLKVVMRDGRMLLELQNDVLFDSGKTELKDVGRKTLVQVAEVLRTLPDRRFQVAGHTDNVKIQTSRFPSNWELSTARAVEVLKLLVESGMDPRNVSAAGYGEFAPVATNDTPDGRARNRRIEIALQPNLAELAAVTAPEPAPPPPPAQPPHH